MSEETQEVAWNLSMQLIIQINNLLLKASNEYLRGNLDKCFWNVKEINILIHSDLSPEEIEEIGKIEKGIRKCNGKKIYNFHLINYREKNIELLNKYGYLIQKKQETGRMF